MGSNHSPSAATRSTCLALSAALACLLAESSPAAVLLVDPINGPHLTIQSALDTMAAGDTVTITPGRYVESLTAPVDVTMIGLGDRSEIVLDGQGEHRILQATHAELDLHHLTFENGRAESGGAISTSADELHVTDCVFIGNHAVGGSGSSAGGAIDVVDPVATLVVTLSLFVDNDAAGFGRASAICHAGSSLAGSAAEGETAIGLLLSDRSTFVVEGEEECPVISAERNVTVRLQDTIVYTRKATDARLVAVRRIQPFGFCTSLFSKWRPGRGSAPVPDGLVQDDPRLLPGTPPVLHGTSPLLRVSCFNAGGLSATGSDPVIMGVDRLRLERDDRAVFALWAYGVDATSSIVLARGARFSPTLDVYIEDTTVYARFDLTHWSPGPAELVVRGGGGSEARIGVDITTRGHRVYGLHPNRMAAAESYVGTLAGYRMRADFECQLVHAETSAEYPVVVTQTVDEESLRVSANLADAAEGVYDLRVHSDEVDFYTMPAVLYIGTPPVLHVPADHPTIAAALEAAPAGADIEIAAGSYVESVVVTKPVRLLGAGKHRTIVRPGAEAQRPMQILSSAGSLTEIHGMQLTGGRAVPGPGGGIYAAPAALISRCQIFQNDVVGPGANGGGIYGEGGLRIRACDVRGNEAHGPGVQAFEDPWTTDPEVGGRGGGIYALDASVSLTSVLGNVADGEGGVVMSGSCVANLFAGNYSAFMQQPGVLGHGLFSGSMHDCEFETHCSGDADVRITSGSTVVGNRFTSTSCEMCYGPPIVWLDGPSRFEHNTAAHYDVHATLGQSTDWLEPERLVVRYNIAEFRISMRGRDPIGLLSPGLPFSRANLEFGCNFGYVAIDDDRCRECAFDGTPTSQFCEIPEYEWPCRSGPWDLRLRSGSPALTLCDEVIGALGAGCSVLPVMLEGVQLTRRDSSVDVRFRLSSDVDITGYRIWREPGGELDGSKVLVREQIPADCRDCAFEDESAPRSELRYWLEVLLADGSAEELSLGVVAEAAAIRELTLLPPAPHPIRAGSALRFALPTSSLVTFELVDVSGRRALRLYQQEMAAGSHQVAWSGRDLTGRRIAAGVYVLRLSAAGATREQKALVLP